MSLIKICTFSVKEEKQNGKNKQLFSLSFVMEVSSESPRVPPGIGWGIYQFPVPEG